MDYFSEETLQEMRSVFDLFDSNKDGTICLSELMKLMQSCGQNPTTKDVEEIMKAADKNADDRIDFQEFAAIMVDAPRDPALELTEAFRMFDKNGDGLVSRQEIKCILGQDLTIDETEIDETVQAADRNGDGNIDIQEVYAQQNEPDFRREPKTGFIDRDELKAILGPDAEADELFDQADTDKIGKIDVEEFARLLTQLFA